MSNFASIQELLNYCEVCHICKNKSELSFDIVEMTDTWLDSYKAFVDKDSIKFYGTISTISNLKSESDHCLYADFELSVNFNKKFNFNSKIKVDEFEFFIESKCINCFNWCLSSKDLLVNKSGIYNIAIEQETISTQDFSLIIDHDDFTLEVFDQNEEIKIMDIDLSNINLDFSDLNMLNEKIKKFTLLS